MCNNDDKGREEGNRGRGWLYKFNKIVCWRSIKYNWILLKTAGWLNFIASGYKLQFSFLEWDPCWIFNASSSSFFLLLSHESLVILSQCLVEHEKKPRRKWKDKFSHVICHHFHVGVRRERSGTSLKFQKDASKAKIISHFLLHFIHMKETERYLRYGAFHIILVASLSLFIDMEMNVMTMLWETVIKFVGFLSTFT